MQALNHTEITMRHDFPYVATHAPFDAVSNASDAISDTTEKFSKNQSQYISSSKIKLADGSSQQYNLVSMQMQEEDRVFLFEKVEHILSFLLAICIIVAVFVLFLFRQRTFLNRVYEKNKYKYHSVDREIYF